METATQTETEATGIAKAVSTVKTEGSPAYRLMRHVCIITKTRHGKAEYHDYMIEGTEAETTEIACSWANKIGHEIVCIRCLNHIAELSLE